MAVGLILLLPLMYDSGWIDTYLCHVLYSSHESTAWIRTADGPRDLIDTRPQLKVPVPRIDRLYAGYFVAVAGPRDELEIFDPRWYSRWRMGDRHVVGYKQAVTEGSRSW